jgi:hypothetical protein
VRIKEIVDQRARGKALMALRSGHGNGAGVPRVEVLPPNEQPKPVPSAKSQPTAALRFRQDGKISDSETAREMGRCGGQAKARRVRLIDSLGLSSVVEQTSFGPYRTAAEEFVSHHRACLALQAGGDLGDTWVWDGATWTQASVVGPPARGAHAMSGP